MIAVARSLPAPVGPPIEWLERSALDLRLPNAGFDAVLCQQGLQFFPEKLVALGQMRRVLVRGGRLALSVWTGIGPYHGAVGEALARYVGNAAVSFAPRDRSLPKTSCSALQAMRAFPTSRCAFVGWISTCPIWINSYCIIWPQHRSHQ
jgi:SAM-dependent methyltransferase